jgi:hypothetical protein
MNMVSLLLLPLVLKFHAVAGVEGTGQKPFAIAVVIAIVALAAIVWAVNKSKMDSPEMAAIEREAESAKA